VVFEQDVGADDGGFQARARVRRLGGLPGGDQLVQLGGVGAGLDLLAQRRVAQQLGDLGQDFQVLLGRGFGHQQEDQQVDRLFVGRVEADRAGQLEQRGHRRLQALDAAVRDGDAVAQAGGAEALAGEQAVGDEGAGEAVQVLEQQAGFLERPLLAGGVDADQDLGGRQDGREAVHGGLGRIMHPPPGKPLQAKRPRQPAFKRQDGPEGPRWPLRGSGPLMLHHALGRVAGGGPACGLVPPDLAIELVDQFVEGGVEVLVGALGEHVVALHVDAALGALPSFLFLLLFDGQRPP
jgi:hypothetical protein